MKKEFLEKAKDLKTAEEIKALAEKEGVKLSDEELEQIAGGGFLLLQLDNPFSPPPMPELKPLDIKPAEGGEKDLARKITY